MIINSPAIVIHSLRYSEADLIVKLFTKSDGLRPYLLKGVLKSKRGKIRSSLFQPLTIIEIEAIHRNKGSLERIKEAKILTPFKTLHTDFVKCSIVFFISEILNNVIKEEEANEDLFEYLETIVIWLDSHDNISNFPISFLLKLTQYLGFYPDITNIKNEYFNMKEGCFENKDSMMYSINGEVLRVLKQFLGTTFDGSMNIRLPKSLKTEIVSVILVYYELHLYDFKKPKSLKILTEIFN